MGDFFDSLMDDGKTPKDLLNQLIIHGPLDIDEAARNLGVEPGKIAAWSELLQKRGLVEAEVVNGKKRLRPGKMLLSSLRNLRTENASAKNGKKVGVVLDVKGGASDRVEPEVAKKSAISELEDKILREKKRNAELEDKIVDLRLEYERRLAEKTQEFNEQVERERSERLKLEKLLEIEKDKQGRG